MNFSAVAEWPWLSRLVFGSRLYATSLRNKAPDRLLLTPPHLWPGEPDRATPFLGPASILPGITKAPEIKPWENLRNDDPKALNFHTFVWLDDLHAVGTDAARRQARALFETWIGGFGSWHPLAWRPDILGERICRWYTHHAFLLDGAEGPVRQVYFQSLARQARHLHRTASAPPQDSRVFHALKGLVYSGICLPGTETFLKDGIAQLGRALDRQILPDGGHISRNPSIMLRVLRHLIDVRETLMAGQTEVPEFLQNAIDRLGPMLRCLRLGDGGFTQFHGGLEITNDEIHQTLFLANTKAKALTSAPHAGYQRLTARRAVLLFDAGGPPPPGFDRKAHAAPLSFELSIGKERLIVNCGAFTGTDAAWRESLRTTAAHSTVTVDDTNAVEIAPDGGLLGKNVHVETQRRENEGNIWLETSHDGYRQRFGIVHKRRLYLAAGGEDIRGDDELKKVSNDDRNSPFAIRFHLHPTVRASLVENGSVVLLRLPSGAGWQLRANGGRLSVEDSIYFGNGQQGRRSRQAVITGACGQNGALIKWRFNRLTASS